MIRIVLTCAGALLLLSAFAKAQAPPSGQPTPSGPPQDVERITEEAIREPVDPLSNIDRPIYRSLQESKKALEAKHGINWALEDTLIYQLTSGGIKPNDAMVNTLGLFATWKIYRADNGKDFGGIGFQFETRGDPLTGHFTEMRGSLGTLWSPNDSTSDDYAKINQLWWGQRLLEGWLGFMIGKIDAGSRINENRFAGSGNTQFFGQPFATNPARSFPDNGIGFMLRAEPVEWLHVHFTMSDSDAISTESPFTTISGNWHYAGEVAYKPVISGLGQGMYRLMVYNRELEENDEVGWSLSFDQNLGDDYGVFLRYGGNEGAINAIEHLVAGGFSWLRPFGRENDEAGVGVSYTIPQDDDLREQYSSDVYYRLQLTEGIELSADAQLIIDPAASDRDVEAVFGLRVRVLY